MHNATTTEAKTTKAQHAEANGNVWRIPPCPTPGCARCEALQTIIGCGECIAAQSEAIARIARGSVREGQTFGERILEVAREFA